MKRTLVISLALIIIAGAFLQMYHIDKESLWTDEMFSLSHARQVDIPALLAAVEEREAAPPLYYIVLHYWIKIFGTSEMAVRALSAAFGVLSIIALFFVVSQIYSRKTALLASALMATSMLHVLYAQEARLYMMFTFVTLLSTYFFVRWLQKPDKRYAVLYGVSMVIAAYTNYMAVVVIALLTFALLWNERYELLKKWLMIHCIVFVASLPLVPLVIAQFIGRSEGLTQTLVQRGLPSFVAQLGLFFFALPSLMIVAVLALLLIFQKSAFANFGLQPEDKNIRFLSMIKNMLRTSVRQFLTFKKRVKYDKLQRFFVSFVVFFCAVYIYAVFFPLPGMREPIINSYFLIRHSLFLAPLIYIYVAHSITKLHARKLQTFCVLLILATNVIALSAYYVSPTKPQWREAVQFIEDNRNNLNQIILLDTGGESHQKLLAYYTGKPYRAVPLTEHTRKRFTQMDAAELQRTIEHEEEFFLILANNPLTNDYYKEMLDARYVRVDSVELHEIRVFHYMQPDKLK